MVTLFWFFFSLIILITLCNVYIVKYAGKRCYDQVEELPFHKVGLVLGTSPDLSNGRPNLYFTYRIDAAAELYKQGKIHYIIVSGDNSRRSYNEPEEMKKALVELGVPEHVIFPDYAGFRTLDSVVRAKAIFGQTHLTIISQKFHNERAVYLAGRNGIEAVGYNARDVNTKAGFKTRTRELFARVKVFIDLIFQKKPKFLGEPIHIPE
ncbi:MAG: YdcF family protein [Bacteroides sp.]|nr:YdcF family protein [Bacteroides sp.]